MMKARLALAVTGVLMGASLAAQAAGTRTHVSNSGNDANTAFSCDYAHPCRTFATALSQTSPGGEILAMDSSGYGKVVIDRSVTIVAAPGVYAGIGVGAGAGVLVSTPGIKVVLRGLSITGQGGTYGVNMTDAANLSIENCLVAGFSGAGRIGIFSTAGTLRVLNTTVQHNNAGIAISSGVLAVVSGSHLLGNTEVGIEVATTPTFTTRATIVDSVVSGSTGLAGVLATSGNAGHVKVSISRSKVTNSYYGIYSAASSTGTSVVTVSDTLSGENAIGFLNFGANATLKSLGNNTVTGSGTVSSGTITSTAPI